MDYEEFSDAIGSNYSLLQTIYDLNKPVGQQVDRKLMKDLRIYMAVGGMPQAVESYINGVNFSIIDQVKRQIIQLYEDDFKKQILQENFLPSIIPFRHSYPKIIKSIGFQAH